MGLKSAFLHVTVQILGAAPDDVTGGPGVDVLLQSNVCKYTWQHLDLTLADIVLLLPQ